MAWRKMRHLPCVAPLGILWPYPCPFPLIGAPQANSVSMKTNGLRAQKNIWSVRPVEQAKSVQQSVRTADYCCRLGGPAMIGSHLSIDEDRKILGMTLGIRASRRSRMCSQWYQPMNEVCHRLFRNLTTGPSMAIATPPTQEANQRLEPFQQ